MAEVNAIDTMLRATGQKIWELQITASTAGDTLLDVPVDTLKRHRIYGIFRLATMELLELVGTSTQGDAVLFAREQLTLTSQVEYDSIIYEIEEEIEQNFYLYGRGWAYILRRQGKRI